MIDARDDTDSIRQAAPGRARVSAALASAKWMGIRAAGRLGVVLNGVLGNRVGERFGILTYHSVAPRPPAVPPSPQNTTPERFREQLSGLQARGFQFLGLSDVLHRHAAEQPIPPRTVVVTFDDGYANVYTRAWPVLRELNVPATVFVATAFLDQREPFPSDPWGVAYHRLLPDEAYQPLTTQQCREMTADGLIELGAHTHTHQDFRGRPEVFRDDLQRSVDVVRERFAVEKVTFAFPFGSVRLGFAGPALVDAARQTDVVCALTTECGSVGPDDDPFAWKRYGVFPWDTAATLAGKLSGWYAWAPRLKQRVERLVARRHTNGAS